MASNNSLLSPAVHTDSTNSAATLSAKRKRDDSMEAHNLTNGNDASKDMGSHVESTKESQDLIRDLIDILRIQDTTPSILTRPLPDRASTSEPQVKRQKAGDGSETNSSILVRLSSGTYTFVDEVLADIDTAVSDIKDMLPTPHYDSEINLKVTAFKQRAHELVRREKLAMGKTDAGSGNAASFAANGGLGSKSFTQINANPDDGKLVLTLYGNAPSAKQLFSSLQLPTKVDGETKDILQTLREAGLPQGIATTRIMSMQSATSNDEKKRTPTLGELFPTPQTVPAMQPPKPSKVATTRSLSVGWYDPTTPDPSLRGSSYFRQIISSGQWLEYSNLSPPQASKRKRDRTTSLGGSKAPLVEMDTVDPEVAKLDSLFRSAYSGFAPTKDDSAALAPASHMQRIWWQRRGEKAFERLVEKAENFESIIDPDLESSAPVTEIDIAEIEAMVEEMERSDSKPGSSTFQDEKSAEEKDVEEVLDGISELLEILNSHQRQRHASLNQNTRSVGLLATADTLSGTPSKPSESEQATYEILKSQLTLMIATLPPYAVAKLDPHRLADLSISTKLEIRTEDYKGVMEEEEAAARAKVAAMSAASTTQRAATPAALHRSGSSALYGNQYAPSRPGTTNNHQYYASAQTPARPASNNMHRPPSTAPPVPYQAQRQAAPAPYRTQAQNYGTPAYAHQNPRPAQQQYSTSTQQQYMHSPSAQSFSRAPPAQNYQSISQSAQQSPINARFAGQPTYPHQAPLPQNSMAYPYTNGANMPRQNSPQKPMYSPQQTAPQPRPYSSTPTTQAMPQNRQQYMPNQMTQSPLPNGTPSQAQQQYHSNPVNYSTFMTTEQQSSLMDRQRAQLAQQQQGMQQQARTAAQVAMTSPSKSQVNGTSAVAAGS